MAETVDAKVKQALDALRERPEALEGVDAADAGALAAVALISGALWSVMAVNAERGMRELDMDWWQ